MIEEAKNAAREEGNREKAAAKAEIEQEVSRAREALRDTGCRAGGSGRGKNPAARSRRENPCRSAAGSAGGAVERNMAETVTIARPYAEAAFKLAHEQNRLEPWSQMLGLLELVAQDADVARCLSDPNVSAQQLESLVLGVCGERLDGAGRNFVQVLVHNNRLAVLPEIRAHVRAIAAGTGGRAGGGNIFGFRGQRCRGRATGAEA